MENKKVETKKTSNKSTRRKRKKLTNTTPINPTNALILSGGGANGAYQIGVIDYMMNTKNILFDAIVGTSVGAINGALLAQDEFSLLSNMWTQINNKDIYKGKVNWFHIAKAIITGKPYILSNDPLRKLLEKYLDPTKLKTDLYIATTDLHSGNEVVHKFSAEKSHLIDKKEYVDIILASTVIPLLWKPVKVGEKLLVDGGVTNNVLYNHGEITEALKNITNHYVVACQPFKTYAKKNTDKNLFTIGSRVINVMMHEMKMEDLQTPKPDNLYVIAPSKPVGDRLDFKNTSNIIRISKGSIDAYEFFEKSDSNKK